MITPKPYATALIGLWILSYWLFIALHSNQALFETQHSRLLLEYGAGNGQLLGEGSYWRIIVSQFTHVKFFHMLGNVAFIFLIGAFVERRFGLLVLIFVYFFGGAIGQYASVRFNPVFVSSGASQALCSLAGFSFIQILKNIRSFSISGIIVFAFIAIQCGLDMYFAEGLKVGHAFGFLAGIVMSFFLLWKANRAVYGTESTKPLRKEVRQLNFPIATRSMVAQAVPDCTVDQRERRTKDNGSENSDQERDEF
jgi:rhomboid protease GluP